MKLFVTDLDGTLLNEDHKISEKSYQALDLVRKRGHKLVFASGRVLSSVRYQLGQAGLEENVIANNGALAYLQDKRICSYSLDYGILEKIVDICHDYGYNFHLYNEDTYFTEELEADRVKHLKTEDGYQVKIREMDGVLSHIIENEIPIYKILIHKGMDEDLDFASEIMKIPGIYVSRSSVSSADIVNAKANKWTACLDIADYMEIDREDIVAIGDFENDYEMVKNSGFGIAMGNAMDLVKEAADYITDSNVKEGFYKAVAYLVDRKIL